MTPDELQNAEFLSSTPHDNPRPSSTISLDNTDYRILQMLQKDSRITNKQLAVAVHLSPTPTFERVKKARARRVHKEIHRRARRRAACMRIHCVLLSKDETTFL